MPAKGLRSATSVSVCRFDLRLGAMAISASKNKSNFPANGLLARRAPFATVWMQPNDSVHHDTIRLVSLNFRFRRRIAVVLRTFYRYREFAARASLTRISPGTGTENKLATQKCLRGQHKRQNLADQCPKKCESRMLNLTVT